MRIYYFIVFILFFIRYGLSQSCIISLQDSVALSIPLEINKNEQSMLSCTASQDKIWVVVMKNIPLLYNFSFDGKKLDSISLDSYMTLKVKPWYIGITTQNDVVIVNIANQFLFYDPARALYQKINFDSKDNSSFYIDADLNHFNFIFHKGKFIIPVDKTKIINTHKNYAKNRLLFALCDTLSSKAKVASHFAPIHSIYHKQYLPHLLGRYLCLDSVKNCIYFSQEATHELNMVDLNKLNKITSFGLPFKHANTNFMLKPYNPTLDQFLLYNQQLTLRIESNLSKQVFLHKDMLLRTYTVSIKDTTTHKIMSKEDYQTYLKTHKRTCSSALPQIITNQVRLEQSKPYGLQIYNQSYELIFDEIMPTPFNILKIENNEIWVHGKYDELNQKYWIYKYKIE